MKKASNKKLTGEFYTPKALANRMAALLLKDLDLEKLEDLRILDPSCGDGELLEAVFFELDYRLAEKESDPVFRRKRIITEILYGMDISRDAIQLTRNRMNRLLNSGPVESGWMHHFRNGDFLIENEPFPEILGQGFSHVIGNPPYIGHKNLDKDYKKLLRARYPGIYTDKTDILSCFFPRGNEMLAEGGRLLFITSRYFIEAPNYIGLRHYLGANFLIERIIDFDQVQVFQEARVASCITLLNKPIGKVLVNSEIAYVSFQKTKEWDENLEDSRLFSQNKLSPDGWIFSSESGLKAFQVIEQAGEIQLREMFNSFQGIITGCDRAFIIKNFKDTVDWNEEEKGLLRPWLKNSHIQPYSIEDKGYSIVYSDLLGYREGLPEDELFKKYPNIMKKMGEHRSKLENRRETRNGIRPWYMLQWGRREEIFRGKKIVHPYKAKVNRFAIDEKGFFSSADVYVLTPKEGFEEYLEYTVSCLNTRIYSAYFRSIGKKMGGELLDYYPNKVMGMKLPLPKREELHQVLELYNRRMKLDSGDVEAHVEVDDEMEILIRKILESHGKLTEN